MNENQLLDRFEDMASGSMNSIKELGIDENLPSIIELSTLIWVSRKLTGLSELEMERIIQREIGLSLDDLAKIEESYYN